MISDTTWPSFINDCSGDIKRLDYVWRYSSIPVAVPENVSTHSYWVAVYAVLIHIKCNPINTQVIGPLLLHSLLHDFPESVTGDIVRVFKYSTPTLKDEIETAERTMIKRFPTLIQNLLAIDLNLICGPEQYVDYDSVKAIQQYKQYIITVVKAADFMSLYQYMTREALRSNYEIIPYYNRFLVDLQAMSQSVTDINNFNAVQYYKDLYAEAVSIGKNSFQNNPEWDIKTGIV